MMLLSETSCPPPFSRSGDDRDRTSGTPCVPASGRSRGPSCRAWATGRTTRNRSRDPDRETSDPPPFVLTDEGRGRKDTSKRKKALLVLQGLLASSCCLPPDLPVAGHRGMGQRDYFASFSSLRNRRIPSRLFSRSSFAIDVDGLSCSSVDRERYMTDRSGRSLETYASW